jgi:hypothetical protein
MKTCATPKRDDRTPIHILAQRSRPSCSCLRIASDRIKMCQLTTNTHSPDAGGTFRWEGEAKRLPQQGLITIRAKITHLNGVSPPPQFPSVRLLQDPIAPAPLIWRSHLTHSQRPTGIPVLPLRMDITPLSPTSGIQHFHSPTSLQHFHSPTFLQHFNRCQHKPQRSQTAKRQALRPLA